VEIEIGVLRGRYLDRRIGECHRIVSEIAAWERQRNAARARVKWMFTTERARDTMASAYPTRAKSHNPCAAVLVCSGILAGHLAFGLAWLFGEPQADLAIAFEDHMHQMAGEAQEQELVSRALQSTVGLLMGVVVYGCALGGIFALVFAYAY